MFSPSVKVQYNDKSWSCSRIGATIYYLFYSRLNQLKTDLKKEDTLLLQETCHLKNIVYHCFHFMRSEVSWVIVSSRSQVQPQIILDLDYLSHYLSISYDYETSMVLSGSSCSFEQKFCFHESKLLIFQLKLVFFGVRS